MNKFAKFTALALSAALSLSFAACGKPHEHVWSDWIYSDETEHYRMCLASGCTSPRATETEPHSGLPCEKCAAFKAAAFHRNGGGDQAHESFVAEANTWFREQAAKNNFLYEETDDWSLLNDAYLEDIDAVLFLDTRPEDEDGRQAFERYMENGGVWLGFHFCAFAMDGSMYDQDWDWYHETFLGAGQYADNTWAPTEELIKVETHALPATENLPDTFLSAPCEWYSWEHDLRQNPDITVLASLDASTFPVGDNPGEIWYEGDYPVIWTNNNYKMLYFNMGHNLVQYGQPYRDLSHTFDCEALCTLVLDGLFSMTDA